MANSFFQFKQFKVEQANAGMKVGTDGVLLGAWTSVNGARNILDIGTGTGLIALMLAQRSNIANIDGLEIEQKASFQARDNFVASQWRERLKVINKSLQNYAADTDVKYDLIVSNPPFFNNALKNVCLQRSIARHTDSLSFMELLAGTVRLLKPEGRFCVVLPAESELSFVKVAEQHQLYLNRILRILPTPQKDAKRVLMEFSFTQHGVEEDLLIVEEFGRHGYSEAYKQLTKDFYLAF